MKRLLIAVLIICVAQSYVVAQKIPEPKELKPTTPNTFRGDPATLPDPQSLANLKWFELFKDEKLHKLIDYQKTIEAAFREDADRELFEAERSLAQARRDELLSVVQLYKAIGGGWQ